MTASRRLDKAERLIAWLAGNQGVAGLAFAIAFRGEGVGFEGYIGYARLSPPEALGPGHAFPMASITKTLTGLLAAILDRQGLLTLREPVGPLLGLDLSVDGVDLTMEHLLSHTSGVPALGYAEALIRGLHFGYRPWRPFTEPWQVARYFEDALKRGAAVARPGERFFYLNEGFVIAGLAMEAVTGKDYRSLAREEVLEPLGLEKVFFLGEEPRLPVAEGHIAGGEGRGLRPAYPPPGILADGGMVASVRDLAVYGLVFARSYEEFGEAVDVQVRPRVEVPWRVTGRDYYGLGIAVHEGFLGGVLVEHGGSLLSHNSWLGVHVDDGVSVAVAVNSPSRLPQIAGLAILADLAGVDPLSLEPVAVAASLSALEGEYTGFDGNYSARLVSRGSYAELDLAGDRVPLLPVEANCRRVVFEAPARLGRVTVEARLGDGAAVLVYDRYVLRKPLIGALPC